MARTISTIVEGAFPDTPETLLYAGFEFQIPENARLLRIKDKTKYILYCSTNFSQMSIEQNPFFTDYEQCRNLPGGFPLESLYANIDWAFDAQRSFITRDGRIYIESGFFHQDWRWYLEAVPNIIQDCNTIFSREKTTGQLNQNPRRAW